MESTAANLLFVDDEPNVLKALKRLFRSEEYRVYLAESGPAGLAILEEQTIDLIISDMRMPEMDGAEFLSLAAERWSETMRILLTGFSDIESTITAVNKGKIYSYCSKPWEDNELKLLVNNALEQKRLRDERQQLFAIINQQNQELKQLNAGLEEKVEKRTEQLKKSLHVIEQTHETLKKQYSDSIKAFARVIEMRPGIKSGHSLYVAEHARKIAVRLEMDAAGIKDVIYAGLLFQIGKMSLPDQLLTQPLMSMSQNQQQRYLNHALEGESLLKGIDQLRNAANLICHQYERFDGTGFPNGLEADSIPTGARILAVIRDYICYLDGSITGAEMTTEEVKRRLESKKGFFYDPEITDIFLGILAEEEEADTRPIIEVTWTQLHAGMEVAEVICNDVLYLKDKILTDKQVEDILNLRKHCKNLTLRVRLGHEHEDPAD